MNVCIFVGRVVRDMELEQTSNGKCFCRFSLAHNSGYGEHKKGHYFQMIAWGKTAETMAKWCPQGTKIAVESEAQQNRWKDKDGNNRESIEFRVISWEFAQGKNDSIDSSEDGTQKQTQDRKPEPKPKQEDSFMDIPSDIDEILPFV